MTTETHDAEAPHVASIGSYLTVWATLLVLTLVTVVVSEFDFGAVNLLIAMGVATLKASLVALVFMHLFHDQKFHSFVFVCALIFLGLFISFTMFDTDKRARLESIQAEHPANIDDPFAGTIRDEERKAHWKSMAAAPVAPAAAAPASTAPTAAAPTEAPAAAPAAVPGSPAAATVPAVP